MHAHIVPGRKSNLYFKLRDRAASTFRPPQSSQVSLMLRQSFSLCFFFNARSFWEKKWRIFMQHFSCNCNNGHSKSNWKLRDVWRLCFICSNNCSNVVSFLFWYAVVAIEHPLVECDKPKAQVKYPPPIWGLVLTSISGKFNITTLYHTPIFSEKNQRFVWPMDKFRKIAVLSGEVVLFFWFKSLDVNNTTQNVPDLESKFHVFPWSIQTRFEQNKLCKL